MSMAGKRYQTALMARDKELPGRFEHLARSFDVSGSGGRSNSLACHQARMSFHEIDILRL